MRYDKVKVSIKIQLVCSRFQLSFISKSIRAQDIYRMRFE